MDHATAQQWATMEFGRVDLGDSRRTARLVAMGIAACERPHGRVAAVFESEREREGAYDFLESEHVAPEEIMVGVANATAARARALPFVVVPVDGTSLTLVDRAGRTDFGVVGTHEAGARGIKVIDALGVAPDGVVLGWLGLTFWTRSPEKRLPEQGTHARRARPVDEKETRYWVQTIEAARAVLDEHRVRGWFQIDREGDSADLLQALDGTRHWWTVRSNADRSIELEGGDRAQLRAELERHKPQGSYLLDVSGRAKRSARRARMVVRTARVTLRLRDRRTNRITRFAVTAVWAREEGTTPAGEDPIDWLLFTNHPASTFEEALLVVRGYSQRWRVEECHRTWKAGGCNIEECQLRSFAAVQRWAIVLASVATRVERLKRLSRTQPHEPATLELSQVEIDALALLKFGTLDRHPAPTIAEVVLWLAEYGGWTGKYSGKPPGATVLSRALVHLRPAARMLELVRRRECEK
jgi:hypothetical protein